MQAGHRRHDDAVRRATRPRCAGCAEIGGASVAEAGLSKESEVGAVVIPKYTQAAMAAMTVLGLKGH